MVAVDTWTVIRRELLTNLRSWKSLVLLLLLLGVLYYVAFGSLDKTAGNAYAAAMDMPIIFNVQIGLLLFAAMSIVPATAAVSLNREQSEGSYDLLLTTLIPPYCIAFGKLLSVLLLFLLTATALLPFTGLVYFFAGVDVYRFFQAAIVILSVALANASLGLWASSHFEAASRAIFVTVGLSIIVNGGLPLLLGWWFSSRILMMMLTPFALLMPSTAMGADWSAYGLFALYQASVAGVAFLLTLYKLSRFRLLRPLQSIARPRILTRPLGTYTLISDWANPIAIREAWANRLAHGRSGKVLFVSVLLVYGYLILRFSGGRNVEVLPAVTAYVERLVLLIVLPPFVAISWAREQETTTWDMLRLTLLKPRDVLIGKIGGLLRVVWPVLGPVYILNCCMMLLYGLTANDEWLLGCLAELIFLPVHTLMILLAALIGVVFTRSITTGIAAAYGSLVVCIFAFGLLTGSMMAGMVEPTGMAVLHAILCTFSIFLGVGVTLARVEGLWQSFASGPTPGYSGSDRSSRPTANK